MKKIIAILILCILAFSFWRSVFAEETRKDRNQLFYTAGVYYEKKDYRKAIDEYLKIPDGGFESGSLYYNIANSFFKLGKLGQAILYYEKAARLMPQDSDLKSNLSYARSMAGVEDGKSSKNVIVRAIKRPFRDLNLNAIAISFAILYILAILILAATILNPFIARKFRAIFVLALGLFILDSVAFGIRYYDEEILKHGIVIQKNAECKYEPIDTSTTYYTLPEAGDVIILKTKEDWRQVERADGKIGWVNKEAVEEI